MKYFLLAIAIVALAIWFLGRRRGGPTRSAGTSRRSALATRAPYPGDFLGAVDVKYAPRPDGRPDPGEIVWTWVPFQEDHTHGKDRPVLLIGHDGRWLLALMLTSKDHVATRSPGDHYLDIGTGAWDNHARPSEVKLDRIVRVDPAAIRREGSILPKSAFEEVRRSLYALHHW